MRDYLTQFEVAEDRMQKAIKQIVKDLDALSRRCRFALRVPSVSRRSLLVPRVGFPGLKKRTSVIALHLRRCRHRTFASWDRAQ